MSAANLFWIIPLVVLLVATAMILITQRSWEREMKRKLDEKHRENDDD